MGKRTYLATAEEKRANIIQVYDLATPRELAEGHSWYITAQNTARALASRYNVDWMDTVAVIAALSPRSNWEQNVRDATAMLAAHASGADTRTVTVRTFGRNRELAAAILDGSAPRSAVKGPKTGPFMRVILDPSTTEVVIDSHAFNISHRQILVKNGNAGALTDARIRDNQTAYQEVAATLGLLPHQVQAVTWVCWRNIMYDGNKIQFHTLDDALAANVPAHAEREV